MSESKNISSSPGTDEKVDVSMTNIAALSEVSNVTGSVKQSKHTTTAERQIKFERAQKCLENAALVSKRIKEHRKATAELLGRPFEEDVGDTTSEMASTMSEKTGYSVATDTSTTLSVQDALNIPGISESLANTLKQKELLIERIKQYKEISKRPMKKAIQSTRKDSVTDSLDVKKPSDSVDVTKLIHTIKEKENNVSVLQVKIKAMETTILDLQEKLTEKDQIIEAKNRATTLMSDNLSRKDKEAMDLLEDTKQQMTLMQTNFVTMETEWKEEKLKLLKEIEGKNEKIKHLEEANTILENTRFEINAAHSKLVEEIEIKTKEVIELQDKIMQLSEASVPGIKEIEEEKGSFEINNMEELSKRIELLEQINFEIRQTNKDLENQLLMINSDSKTNIPPSKKGSPLPSRKGSRNTTTKMKSPWSNLSSESLPQEHDKKGKNDKTKQDTLLQSLNKEILEKEYIISQKDKLISELQSNNVKNGTIISELQLLANSQKEAVDMVSIGTNTDLQVPKIERNFDQSTLETETTLEEKLKLAQEQIAILNHEIDSANKNMIKVKSSSKLKLKQMQKTIDNFSKVSDTNAEIVKLNEELHQLTQKVAELEEEKGNLQLHLVDYDSGRLTETEIYKKMVEMETLAETRLKSISLLETQKFDLVQELHSLQQNNLELEDKLADVSLLQNEQVCSEMKSVQLEEQIDELQAAKKELELIVDNLKLDKEQFNGTVKILQNEKEELIQKLENYIQENIELTDKLEKLSAEKVSSAESIEIVESLTTQEKLELEEYNKGLEGENKTDANSSETHKISDCQEYDKSNDKFIEETIELKKKIELFTSERKEVMEKMNKISLENESLIKKISELNNNCACLRTNIDLLNEEKVNLISLNEELSQKIEELKLERTEILKETAEATKPLHIEDVVDASLVETLHHDDKSAGDKGNNKTKSVKQLTKEILKLKNTIKEREDEIADCQMKILSLEEQHEKQMSASQSKASFEKELKKLTDENSQLKKDIENMNKDNKAEQYTILVQTHEMLQLDIQKLHQEYSTALNARDSRIHELENLLLEYEKQVINYSNTLQQKDKEMSEYINQITKLNDVSQKLKSTIDVLEDEKAKDQNSELVKSLNIQIDLYQKSLTDYEEKIRTLEDDKVQLASLKSQLENQISTLESEIKRLQQSLTEKQNLTKELQTQQQKQTEELSSVLLQSKERDEEIHEIKLQLRKESIDNEKLHNIVVQKSNEIGELKKLYEDAKEKLSSISFTNSIQNDQYLALETKNKELMEKLKKFAINTKKKSAMFAELEQKLQEVQKQLEIKNEQYEQLAIQVETIPALQEKLKHAEEEFNRLQSQKIVLEQKSHEILQLQSEIEHLRKNSANDTETITKLNDTLNLLNKDLFIYREENNNLNAQIGTLNNRIVEYEIDQKNNANLLTKILCLETDIKQKQDRIEELSNEVEIQNEKLSQIQFGHDAKVQERDAYIESLQSEIDKYKNRINRLEDTISTMENRRQYLERKADKLDSQLHEKQNAYNEYTSQEDELVSRLAVLIDNDRVVEKQLHEIENENKELRSKIQHLNEEFQQIHKSYCEVQHKCSVLELNAKEAETTESKILTYESQIRELDSNLKRLTNEHSTLLAQKKKEIEDLEFEFNTQIENAIKDKKVLNEKYEKVNDNVSQLELQLQESRVTVENLSTNLEELALENQNLTEKFRTNDKMSSPDYTEQYISEINNLNSLLNSKNQEISELCNTIQSLQHKHLSQISTLENKNVQLTKNIEMLSIQINETVKDNDSIKQNNDQLQMLICQKDEQIKQLMENKKVIFEMNIPKTEGLTISSTIEAMDDKQKEFDISSLQSQIISKADSMPIETEHAVQKISEQTQSLQDSLTSEGLIEPSIVPKKTYLCYKLENDTAEPDPFNSEEGWGLGPNEETDDVTPGFTQLNQQIQLLNDANRKLKVELDNTNAKLLKALKKLRDLKVTNDMLTNELKLSKQISQSSMLDMTIESELSNNLEVLEKKVQELNTDLNKEKKEKEAVKKQNNIFKNANDRLLEMKEKLENEMELWKFNYKQATVKISTLQWSGDCKDSIDNIPKSMPDVQQLDESEFNKKLLKLEEENDELQTTLDNVNSQNKQLCIKNDHMQEEINNLKRQLQQLQSKCDNCDILNDRYQKLTIEHDELKNEIYHLKENLKSHSLTYENCEKLSSQLKELQSINATFEQKNATIMENTRLLEIHCSELREENQKLQKLVEEKTNECENIIRESTENKLLLMQDLESLKALESEAKSKISFCNTELDNMKLKLSLAEEKRTEEESKVSALCAELEEVKTNLRMSMEDKSLNQVHDINVLALTEKYNSMEEYCLNLKNNLDDSDNKIQKLELENRDLLDKISENDNQMSELNTKLQNLNAENDQLLSTVTELRSSVSSAMDQRGFEIAELWKQHLAQRESEFQKNEQDLRSQLDASQTKYEQLLENVQSSSEEETKKIIMAEHISSLQNKLEEKEQHILNLREKYAEAINQLDLLRSEMEDEKVIQENKVFVHQEEYEKVLQELKIQNQDLCHQYENTIRNLQSELDATKTVNDNLNLQVEDLRNSHEVKVNDLTRQLQHKESEIFQKTRDFTISLQQRNEEFETVRKQLLEYEKKVEDLTYEKESELAILRLKMHERTSSSDKIRKELESEKEILAKSLNDKIDECINLNKHILDLNKVLEEYINRASETQIVLENQEIDIVTLKDEISNLKDDLRKATTKTEKFVTFASDTKQEVDTGKTQNTLDKELLDAVPRAELDLALYMLHQRDVRCEELTMELTQLLEERDTLQLRLSDSLRSYEEIKSRCNLSGLDVSVSSSHEGLSELPCFSVEKEGQFVDTHRGQTSRSSSVSDPDGEKPKLQAKLTELRSVKHNRDVRLRHESEQRQLGMRLLQRDIAKLPSEAVDQLTQAHHTLSRDTQSTPTVLLNWLRGKSTPKVVHM